MKKTLIVAAIVLAIGIPVATVAHRQLAARNDGTKTEKADSCCPASKPARSDTAAKNDALSCPYTGAKHAKADKAEPKSRTMPKSEKLCGKAATHGTCPTVKSSKPAVATTAPKPAPKEAAKPVEAKTVESAVCPVMKAAIPDVSKSAGHSVYKGKTYYFCCAGCKPLFDKDPEKYIGG